jgi:DNA-binding NarL/FixJ family response regulator
MDDYMIHVVIIDDHPIVRAGMRSVLECTDDIRVMGEGGSANEAISLVDQCSPDVLVLDIGLPDKSGLEVASYLQKRNPTTAILILTAYNNPEMLFNLLENGAIGYVLKDEALETLANAVRAASAGKSWLSPSIAGNVIQRAINREKEQPVENHLPEKNESLTQRESEILCLLAEGLDNTAIAQRLTITKRTVQNHITNIYAKMGAKSRTEAMLFAIQHGIARVI